MHGSQHTEQCKEQLKRRAKEAADECEKMQQAARAEAEEFDPENRSVEGERLWNALPSDETELEADIDTLKEDTAFNDSDKSGSTLRDFQERQRRIEDINAVIARTREEATAKEADVRRLEASWKPGLKRMIEQVTHLRPRAPRACSVRVMCAYFECLLVHETLPCS